MECPFCRGDLVQKKVSYTATRNGYHLIIDHLPAWVCEQCGEPLFDEKTVDAIQELLRYLSPLPAMARVPPDQQPLPDEERDASLFTSISFVSANYDDEVFPNPEVVELGRQRIPHVAFGFGPHTCIGNNIAEIETETILCAALPRSSVSRSEVG